MTINVMNGYGEHQVEAVQSAVPGLAYHKALNEKGWTITHIKSGYSVFRGVKTRALLKHALAELGKLPIDWTKSRTATRKAAKPHMAAIVQIARDVT